MHPVTKIISGGQTGADQGGLRAGLALGIKTGGTAPPGFMTDTGPNLFLKEFGLVEGKPDPRTYPKRTYRNVVDSDGTVLFGNMGSPGSRLTIRYCENLKKPYIIDPTPDTLLKWVIEKDIHTLNVAGNRERTNPHIYMVAMATIMQALAIRKGDEGEDR